MNILFITSTRIGDAILTTGLLAHLKEKYPSAKITVACGPLAAPLFEDTDLERVIAVAKKPLSLHWLILYLQVYKTKWDLVVDLRRSILSSVLKAKEKIVHEKSDMTRHKVLSLSALLKLEKPVAPEIVADEHHEAIASDFIPRHYPVIGIVAAANWVGKEWEMEKWVALVKKITAADGWMPHAQIALFGARHDRKKLQPIMDGLPAGQVLDLIGKVDLLTAFTAARRCDLILSVDSGMMHLAAACGQPVLGLFGPSSDVVYGPWGKNCAVVRTPEEFSYFEKVRKMGGAKEGSFMHSLSVEMVEKAARDLWDRAGDKSVLS